MGLQKRLHDSEILLDLAASDLQGLVQQALGELVRLGKLDDRQRQAIRNTLDERGEGELHDLGSGVGVLRVRYEAQNGDSYRCARSSAFPRGFAPATTRGFTMSG